MDSMKPKTTGITIKLFRFIFIVIILVSTAYLFLMSYLLIGWFLDDTVALKMHSFDWLLVAIKRFIMFFVVGIVYGGLIYLLLRFIYGWKSGNKWPFRISIIISISLIVFSALQALLFFINKPFI